MRQLVTPTAPVPSPPSTSHAYYPRPAPIFTTHELHRTDTLHPTQSTALAVLSPVAVPALTAISSHSPHLLLPCSCSCSCRPMRVRPLSLDPSMETHTESSFLHCRVGWAAADARHRTYTSSEAHTLGRSTACSHAPIVWRHTDTLENMKPNKLHTFRVAASLTWQIN